MMIIKKIWLYQAIILSVLSLKKDDGNVSHYTNYEVLKSLIGFDNEKSPIRMNSLLTANDPNEGAVLLDILKDKNVVAEQNTNDNLCALQASFSKNIDSLTMFRFYGKKEHKEATGVSLVFDSSFFDLEIKSNMVTFEASINLGSNGSEKVEKVEKSNKPKLPLFYVLYYDRENNILVFNRKDDKKRNPKQKHGQNVYVNLNIEERGSGEDFYKKGDAEKLEYCFSKIFEIINASDDKQTCYDLLINLKYLIKSDAWLEESELRLIEITELSDSEIKTETDSSLYKEYLEILPDLKGVILGSKIENVFIKKEILKKHLQENSSNAKISISKAPIN